jgi:hypothetical protein
MQSIDSLRELNAKLLAEIAKLRKKFSEIKIENDDNKSRPLLSILPDDPEEKQEHVIGLVLEWFSYLSFRGRNTYSDGFDLRVFSL